jgi:hypothetical protein
MISVLTTSVVDCVFKAWSGHTKDYKIDICYFSTKHAALRTKSKDGLAWNQDVSEWCVGLTQRLVGLESGCVRVVCWSNTKTGWLGIRMCQSGVLV